VEKALPRVPAVVSATVFELCQESVQRRSYMGGLINLV